MAVSIKTGKGTGKKLGWLIWWTVHQGAYDEAGLKRAGQGAGIPSWMVDRIKGRSERSAWSVATQLGARGEPSASLPEEDGTMRAIYLARDVQFETPTRAVVREVTNQYEERVSSETVALVRLYGKAITTELVDVPADLQPELEDLLGRMRKKMDRLLGKVGDAKARSLLLDYLERRYRICVRGSGGVYLVPRPSDPSSANAVEKELLALRDWVGGEPLNSLFSIVELTDAGATTVDVFVESAVEELKADINSVHARLQEWKSNDGMNAGSKMFSAGEMVKRCAIIGEKVTALEDALGEEVGVTRQMLETVAAKARRMQHGSAIIIGKAKAKREREQTQKGKKGTAKQRAKAKKL